MNCYIPDFCTHKKEFLHRAECIKIEIKIKSLKNTLYIMNTKNDLLKHVDLSYIEESSKTFLIIKYYFFNGLFICKLKGPCTRFEVEHASYN